MADFTSNLFLAIHAKDLTGPGFLGASVGLRTFAAVGAAAMGGLVVGAVKAAASYQTLVNQVANNTTMGAAGAAQMSTAIQAMAAKTSAPLDQLAQGWMHITNLGFSAAQAQTILNAAQQSAVSTGGNTADVANVLANAMHEYGANTNQAARYMDVLHLAAAQGNATLEQFAEGGGKAIAMAANLGVPITQVAAAISALTRHGQDVPTAATSMTSMLSHIVNPVKSARTELAKLQLATGINLLGDFSAQGLRTRGLTGIIADLRAAITNKKGQVDASELFKIMPAKVGGLGAQVLTGSGTQDYTSILGSLQTTMAGKTTPTVDAFARTTKTLGFTLGQLRNTVELLGISLGTKLLPYVTQAATWLGARLPQAVAALMPRLTVLVTDGLAVGRAFVAAVGAMTRLASGLKGLVAPLLGVTTHLGTTRKGATQLGAGLALLIPAIVAIKVGMIAWRVAEVGVQAALVAGRAAALAWRGAVLLAQGAMLLWRGAVIAATVVTTAYTAANEALSLAYVALRLGVIGSTAATIGNKIATIELQAWYVSQRVITIATTAATWLWTTALEASRIAVLAVGIAGWKGVAAMTAQAVAGLAVRAATALWTGAQWLLNAALYANPIGLVIAAVAALVIGVVWAYKNVGWFHDAVNKAWTFLSSVFAPGLGTVAGALKNVLGAAISWVTDKIKGLIGFFGNLLHMVSSIPGVKAVIGAAYTAAGVTPPTTSGGHHGPAHHGASGHHGAAGVPFVGPGRGLIAARFGAAYNHGGTPQAGHGHHGLTAAQQRAWDLLHPPGKPKKGIVGGHNYNTDLTTAMNTYSDDMKLYRAGLISQTKILSDIAAIGKVEHAGRLTDTTARLRNDVNTANKLTAHHAEVKAGAKAKTAQTKQFHQRTTDLGALYYRDTMTLQQDMRDRNFAAARQVIAAMTSIKQAIEVQHGISKSQAAQDARAFSNNKLSVLDAAMKKTHKAAAPDQAAYWKKQFGLDKTAGNTTGELSDLAKYYTADLANLTARYPQALAADRRQAVQDRATLANGLLTGLKKLTAHPMGSGFHRSVYGYTSRQQVGQGVGLGETLVTFGGRVGKDPAQQMIEKLDAQVQQLTQQNAALTALLSVAEEGVTATLSVRDAIARGSRALPGAGIGNPLRVQGLATAVR